MVESESGLSLFCFFKVFFFTISSAMYEGKSKITESWLISFYWVGSFG